MPRKAAPAAPYTLMSLACSALQVDPDIQPRLALDRQVVAKYATLYQEDEEGQTTLPPLDVFQVARPTTSRMAFTGWRPLSRPAGKPCPVMYI